MAVSQRPSDWKKLSLSLTELCIDTTLRCGQSFRWRRINDEWHCALQGRLISLKQDPSHLHYKVTWPSKPAAIVPLTPPLSLNSKCLTSTAKEIECQDDDTASLLHSYFALSHSLAALYKQWATSDANFARRALAFTGIRILNQDAWETLVAFICSSNNNISRITQMVHKLCIHYGPYVGTIDGEAFHDFPRPEALAGGQVETHLRELGFGYRAKYIAETARIVSAERPAGWLLRLRNPRCPALGVPTEQEEKEESKDDIEPPSYRVAHDALLQLAGVGPKVADCVCLMGLGFGEAVPIDTHVWQIAQRDYNLGKGVKTKTFSKALYDTIGDYFRKIWGQQAGWAQSVLFTANLKSFAEQASGVKTGRSGTAAVVKLEFEETQIMTPSPTGVRTRKRKTISTKVVTKFELEDDSDQTAETNIVTRRTSKRRKTKS
ncbi:N-glycosylase/DNA lyase [Lasiosphaeris hirsuta]|uniref:DNA-(apurinic or apyrimidinic site) lyase n=1 Tax=Lasiosphaeris hirsuta TaxID=260670 RepID=A0AA40BAW3_9PEZI|nr:N-glycosylase/DNA lyase [Lasiosphaeris hirsuta]